MRISAVISNVLLSILFAATGAACADWQLGPEMNAVHSYFVSGRLPGDKVIAVGGGYSKTAETLAAGSPAWASAGSLGRIRTFFGGVVLNNGAFLAAGGDNALDGSATASQTAEIWTEESGTFTQTGHMNSARQAFSLTALPNGKALAIGGSGALASGAGMSSAELFDAGSGTWSQAASMKRGRLGHTATLLRTCRVLIVGDSPTAELYNYRSDTFSDGGTEMSGGSPLQRSYHTATLLPDGKVLIAGGVNAGNSPLATAVLYDPASDSFSSAQSMNTARSQALAVLMADGRVLVAGGTNNSQQVIKKADIYDPASNSWSAAPDMVFGVAGAAGEPLPDGKVLVMGGTQDLPPSVTQIFSPDLGGTVLPPSIDCSGSPGGGDATLTFGTISASPAGKISIPVTASADGTLGASATYGKKIVYGKSKSFPAAAGVEGMMVIKPSKGAKAVLKTVKKLKVAVTITLKPASGDAVTKKSSVSVKTRNNR